MGEARIAPSERHSISEARTWVRRCVGQVISGSCSEPEGRKNQLAGVVLRSLL